MVVVVVYKIVLPMILPASYEDENANALALGSKWAHPLKNNEYQGAAEVCAEAQTALTACS